MQYPNAGDHKTTAQRLQARSRINGTPGSP